MELRIRLDFPHSALDRAWGGLTNRKNRAILMRKRSQGHSRRPQWWGKN